MVLNGGGFAVKRLWMPPIELNEEEREFLEAQVRRRKVSRALAERSAIILACSEGRQHKDIAEELGITAHTVGRWRRRFYLERLEGLLDEPRAGRPREIEDEQVEAVLALTLENKPEDATHWSTRSMAKASGLSRSSISRIWRAFGLQPHRTETFKLSNDPQFVEKVRDIVGLYLSPPVQALVLCVDEKSQIQALNRTQPVLPLAPGICERQTHDYLRNGTSSLFAALNVVTGSVIGKCFKKHTSKEFLKFLTEIDRNVPPELDIHLVMDNYATHKTQAVRNWFARRPRYHVHFTPTYASWLNQVERWFGLLTEKQLRRGVHPTVQALEKDIQRFIDCHNQNPKPFKWVKSADEILASVKRFCLKQMNRTSEIGY
jgi:transposase